MKQYEISSNKMRDAYEKLLYKMRDTNDRMTKKELFSARFLIYERDESTCKICGLDFKQKENEMKRNIAISQLLTSRF